MSEIVAKLEWRVDLVEVLSEGIFLPLVLIIYEDRILEGFVFSNESMFAFMKQLLLMQKSALIKIENAA